MVQRNAMEVWAGNGNYLDLLKAESDVTSYLDEQELEALFDLAQHFKHVDTIFNRVFRS